MFCGVCQVAEMGTKSTVFDYILFNKVMNYRLTFMAISHTSSLMLAKFGKAEWTFVLTCLSEM